MRPGVMDVRRQSHRAVLDQRSAVDVYVVLGEFRPDAGVEDYAIGATCARSGCRHGGTPPRGDSPVQHPTCGSLRPGPRENRVNSMSCRRLLSLFLFATLGMTPESWGAEREVTPIISFGNPSEAGHISVTNARLSRVTGTRVNAGGVAARIAFELAEWPQLMIGPTEGPADWSGGDRTRNTRRQPDGRADRLDRSRRR